MWIEWDVAAAIALVLAAGCSTVPRSDRLALHTAAQSLKLARSPARATEERVALYLEAAALSLRELETPAAEPRARHEAPGAGSA